MGHSDGYAILEALVALAIASAVLALGFTITSTASSRLAAARNEQAAVLTTHAVLVQATWGRAPSTPDREDRDAASGGMVSIRREPVTLQVTDRAGATLGDADTVIRVGATARVSRETGSRTVTLWTVGPPGAP